MLDQVLTLVVEAVALVLLVVMHLGVVAVTLPEMELLEMVVLVEQTLLYPDLFLVQSCLVHG
tara:strand:- start:308 stop:493 length:186 start_codon:yes stop_codon:yes gene_type:complete